MEVTMNDAYKNFKVLSKSHYNKCQETSKLPFERVLFGPVLT